MTTHDEHEWDVAEAEAGPASIRVLLYSDHPETREAVRLAVGRRLARDLPPLEWHEVATPAAALSAVEAGEADLVILDGEAGKNGGMGLCRQMKDEIFRCPPVVVLIARPQDAWLASWSTADEVVVRPLDPVTVASAITALVRRTAVAG